MKFILVISFAFALVQLDSVQAKPHRKAIRDVAETVVGHATDKVNETPQVEQTGGFRKQILHKGADLASSSLVSKGASLVMSSAAKYPLMAAAAPIALPLAKAAATALVLNEVHKTINGMGKSKNAAETTDNNSTDNEDENGSNQKKGLMDKITGVFKKDESEAKDPETKENQDKDGSKKDEPEGEKSKEETTTTTEKPKPEEVEQ